MNLIELYKQNSYDYLNIYNHPKTIKRISNGNREINFYISVKDRTEFFRPTLRNILEAKKESPIKVKIIVVEQNNESLNDEFCKELNVDYIFIPQELAQCGEFHSTSLMYNVGYLFARQARFNMFHCADILLPFNFFKILSKNYLNKEFNWLQPFHNKRVMLIDEETTQKYINGEWVYGDYDPWRLPERFVKPENSGAPGGCLCLKSETMDEIGGYSPELYWGYSSEDREIWTRLECYFGKKQATGTHIGNATYADDPIIDIYHFSHPRAQNLNPKFNEMEEYFNTYVSLNYEEQMEIIKYKSEEFKKQKQLINDIKGRS